MNPRSQCQVVAGFREVRESHSARPVAEGSLSPLSGPRELHRSGF